MKSLSEKVKVQFVQNLQEKSQTNYIQRIQLAHPILQFECMNVQAFLLFPFL